jgi:ABC-2 type transport system permease protein
MSKFWVLLKKEIGEFLNLQQMLPLIVTVIAFVMLGKIIGSEGARQRNEEKPKPGVKAGILPAKIAALDEDRTPASQKLLDQAIGDPDRIYKNGSAETVLRDARRKEMKALIVIPKGFEADLEAGKPQKFPYYTLVGSLSLSSAKDGYLGSSGIGGINGVLSDELLRRKLPSADPEYMKNPVQGREFVVVGNRIAETSFGQVMGALSSQLIIIPVLLYMLIVFATQIVAVAMASEQENKTLETLLSAPVNRNAIVLAKLLGAGVVALLFMLVYMLGFRYYMGGFAGGGEAASGSVNAALQSLGLVYQPVGYALLAASLFFGLLTALAIAMILGTFAEDVKGVQPLIMPLTLITLVPYLFVLVLDFSKLSPAVKLLVYAIPFSHPFLASQNLLLHRYAPVVYGILYEAAVFALFVFIASRLFSSDRILTMKTSLRLRREARKAA